MEKPRISTSAVEGLNREHGFLRAARTFHKSGNIQEVFADAAIESDAISVIRQFVAMLKVGLTPPPHVLLAIGERLAGYLESNGNQSLDYAFGLISKPSVGHPLEHRAMQEQRGQIVWRMWELRKRAAEDGGSRSISNAAAQVINDLNLSVTESALEKSYKAMQADTIFDGAWEILKEMKD